MNDHDVKSYETIEKLSCTKELLSHFLNSNQWYNTCKAIDYLDTISNDLLSSMKDKPNTEELEKIQIDTRNKFKIDLGLPTE